MEEKIAISDSTKVRLEKPRQARALIGKSIHYQKRQNFTNICCISLCPIMMVAISAFLGSLIAGLIARSQAPDEYIYCSNLPALNEINIPYWRNANRFLQKTPPDYPGATLSFLYHSNWAIVRYITVSGPPGAAGASFKRPCVYWYGEQYPNSTVYERSPRATGKVIRDSTYLAQPIGGWIPNLLRGNTTLVDSLSLNIFNNHQSRPWYIYTADAGVDQALLGSKPRLPNLNATQYALLPNNTPPFVSPAVPNTGILGTIPTRYFLNISAIANNAATSNSGFSLVPWFEYTAGDGNTLDNFISERLNSVINDIAKIEKSDLIAGSLVAQNRIFLEAQKFLQNLPHGGIHFKTIDHRSLKYAWNYHCGADLRLTATSNFPSTGRRLLHQQTQLDNAILRNSNITRLGSSQITQGLRILPQVGSTEVKLAFDGIIGAILNPFGVSFLLPVFAVILVQEKENRILVMMKMNGMKTWAYYLSHYLTFFGLYTISAFIFLIAGGLAKMTMFTLTDKGLLALLFFLWGQNQISLAFFFSTLFNKSRFALVIVFLIVLCCVIISLVIDQLFLYNPCPSGYFVWPPFAFYRALGVLNRVSFTAGMRAYTMGQVVPGDEIHTILSFMAAEIPIYFLLAFYLESVFPTEFGVRKPWHFPITDLIKMYENNKEKQLNGGIHKSEAELATAIQINEEELKFEDSDVKKERQRVFASDFNYEKHTLVLKNMRKVYAGRGGAGPKLAVKDVTLAVEPGLTFGLLGPNGAGKTTLISILTGLYEASSGFATIAGYDIKNETDKVYKTIGICPQFDIQWDDLTVGEHMYFYARLKGIVPNDERKSIEKALQEVSLLSFEHRLTKGLSGGEKRRLSIAIALLGNPSVVFLDEPTTGLDPAVRRLIWDIVNTARSGRTIVLTTHSMEEAEALCQRIGIMAKGTLRCLANPTRLKEVYGSGFKIYLNTIEEKTDVACRFVESVLPSGWKKIDSFATNTSYEFPAIKGVLTTVFDAIEKGKVEYGITDWGIGQTTLEEVFLRLISESDASAEY